MSHLFPPTDEIAHGVAFWQSVSTYTVGQNDWLSWCLDSTRRRQIQWDTALPFDITTVGPGGMDAGPEAAGWIKLCVMTGKTVPVATIGHLWSPGAPDPVLPTGYDAWRRVRWIFNTAGLDLRKDEMIEDGRTRLIGYDENRAALQPLNGGSATVFTPVSFANYLPPNALYYCANVAFDAQTPKDFFRIRPTGSIVTDPCHTYAIGQTSPVAIGLFISGCVGTNRQVDYVVSNGSDALDIFICAYRDRLND